MRMRTVIAMLLSSIALVSCGGGATENSLAAVTLASSRTSEAGTARFAMDIEMDSGGQAVTGTGSGELDLADGIAHITTTMQGIPGAGDVESEIYSAGFKMWMRSDSFGVPVPGVKEWIEIDLQALGEEFGFSFEALQQLGQNDPTTSLDYLKGAKSVEDLGEEEIRGTPTIHYRVVVDWDLAVQEAPEDSREALRANIDLIERWTGEEEMTFDVWLDEEGRMRRQSMRFDYVEGELAGTSMDMTVEMFDFGAEVDIQLPDPDQVTPFAELMETIQRGG